MILVFNPRYRRQQYLTGEFGFVRTITAEVIIPDPFMDGNGRVFYLPARATQWRQPARTTRWVLRR